MTKRQERALDRLEGHQNDASPKLLCSVYEAFGFVKVRQTGSHIFYRHPSGRKVHFPAHRPVGVTYTKEAMRILQALAKEED